MYIFVYVIDCNIENIPFLVPWGARWSSIRRVRKDNFRIVTRDLCCVITDCPAVGRWKKLWAVSSGQVKTRTMNAEWNWTLRYNFSLNYSQVLQVVSTFRAGSTCRLAPSEPQRQVAQIILSNYGNALSALNQSGFTDCVGHADGTWKRFFGVSK